VALLAPAFRFLTDASAAILNPETSTKEYPRASAIPSGRSRKPPTTRQCSLPAPGTGVANNPRCRLPASARRIVALDAC
jgi:hypothetical protein